MHMPFTSTRNTQLTELTHSIGKLTNIADAPAAPETGNRLAFVNPAGYVR